MAFLTHARMLLCMAATSDTQAKKKAGLFSGALASFVEAIDRLLRHRLQVIEYSNSRDCLFRLQIINSEDSVVLVDGTRLHPGDRVIDLHLWNEQVPLMPDGAPTLAFARRVERCIDLSLSELAGYLRGRSDLGDIQAIRGNMSLGASERSNQIARIASRYGFERAKGRELSFGENVHRLGENILITMLAIAHNPGSLKADTLRRDRTLTYLSRGVLERRYGMR
jgi:hypothetical protein